MKNKVIILISLMLLAGYGLKAQSDDALVMACSQAAGEDANYLKDFIVKKEMAAPGERAPIEKFSMVLSKNTQYRFSICTAADSEGRGIIQVFDSNRLLGTSFNEATGKEFPSFDLKCQKTGVYHVFISFQGGKAGKAVGILSYVQKL